MPRPGPRPYDCVRRAWHSETHQPIRGSIIQQTFRVVHERHGFQTKKNREWQEKLPGVVFKAEEIMYSKANSEAEYMDLDTLWDRLNDAIDTIIRKDENAETGQFLPPCVEAALNLGCVPVRASRSQRHNTSRSYLNPTTDETDVSPDVVGTEINLTMSSVDPASRLGLGTTINVKSVDLASDVGVDTVYPLYYGNEIHPEVRLLKSQELRKSEGIILGVPVFPSSVELADVGMPRIIYPENRTLAHRACHREDFRDISRVASEMECDLSLRLGFSSGSGSGMVADSIGDTPSATPSNYQREFSFFPIEASDDTSLEQTRRHKLERGGQFPETVIEKRKAFVANMDNWQFSWPDEPTSKHFAGQLRGPGL